MATVTNLAVQRCDVVVMSNEFLELAKELPEISTAPYVKVGGKLVEGAQVIMVAISLAEVWQRLPAIVAQMTDRKKQHIRVIEHCGECRECAGKEKACEHLGRTIRSLSRAYDTDVNKIIKAI